MRVGVTGHQERKGIEWEWVGRAFREELVRLTDVAEGWTSLAVGTDQVFASVCLDLSIPITAVIPMPDYERSFSQSALNAYRSLLRASRIVQLEGAVTDEEAFYKAGHTVVDNCDLLFALWDGLSSRGKGGTADIVRYATTISRPVRWINPFERTVSDYLGR